MCRTDFAEWILSLTTSRERAAAIAGDLAERSRVRGGGWFWASLLRTAAALAWRDFAADPLRVTGLAVGGFILQAGIMLAVMTGILFVRVFVAYQLGVVPVEAAEVGIPFDLAWPLQSTAAYLISGYLIGKWLARRARHQELMVYVGMCVVGHLLWIPILLIGALAGVTPNLVSNSVVDVVVTAMGTTVTLLGVKREQRQPAA